MIRITPKAKGWEAMVIEDYDAEGLAELLDADGVEYEWEDLNTPAPAAKTAPAAQTVDPVIWADDRPERAVRLTRAEEEARALDAYAQAQAELKARAAAAEVPAWVIRVREDMDTARKWRKDPRYFGVIKTRANGEMYYSDCFGAHEGLPDDAKAFFIDGQTAP